MRRGQLLAAGFGIYAIALIATAPATFADAGLRHASEGRLRIAEARGTLWTGSGLIEVRTAAGQSGVARILAWHVVPQSLLGGHVVCEIELEQENRRFPVTLAMSRLELANADIRLPASVLGMGLAMLAPLGLTGEVQVHVASLSLTRDRLQGNATLQWRSAGSVLTQVSPLGDYELRLDAEGATVSAILLTLEGPLQLEGNGSWTRGARPVFLGTATVTPQHQQQLAPLLRLISIERSAGSFELRIN